jgi:hypothetical protein
MVQCEKGAAKRRDAQLRGRMMTMFATLSAAAAVAVVVMSVGGVRAPVAGEGERVVLLRQAVTQKLEQDGKCDAACLQKAAMVKEQMKALREEINRYVEPASPLLAQLVSHSC